MYEYRAYISRVIDGDTLEVDIDLGFKTTLKKEKLRLLGIDTPEMRSKSLQERLHAASAKQFVEDLVAKMGNEITVHTEKDKAGKYGRYLARVILSSGEDLSDLLVENGFEKKSGYKIDISKIE